MLFMNMTFQDAFSGEVQFTFITTILAMNFLLVKISTRDIIKNLISINSSYRKMINLSMFFPQFFCFKIKLAHSTFKYISMHYIHVFKNIFFSLKRFISIQSL